MKVLKWIGGLILAVIVFGGGIAAHEWYAEKPWSFRVFLDREVLKVVLDSPEGLSSLGFLESMGIKGHNAKLDDASPEKTDALMAKMHDVHKVLVSYDNLDKDQQLSYDIALYLLDSVIEGEKFRYHDYPVNQLFGVQNGYPSFMQAQHQVNDEQDADYYLSRLSAVGTKFEQVVQGLERRTERGILPPTFVIDRVLTEMTDFVNTPANENILYQSFETKLDAIEALPEATKADFLAQAEARIKADVYPAYELLINYFEKVKPQSNSDDGLWRLPNGLDAYNHALAFFTTTDYTAEQLHQLGLSEVDRIQADMLAILSEQGIDTSNGFTAAMEVLSERSEFYYEDSDEGRAQILADYQIILDEINEGLDDAFRIRPKAGLEVVRIPEFKEKTAPGAYYQQPSMDGSRPGRFFANLYDIKATPKYGMRTLAYHEGIPGHHFQIAIAMELEGLPFIRKMAPFTAYIEGWALYSEQLAYELGFQTNPYDNVGRLTAELFRAVRLVVDTGIHAKRWTREEAIAYMLANTGMAESDVVSEIERYIVMPGQATSYKVGMIKILELREKAKSQLGDKFDLRDFHDAVLKNGAVPLSVLEQIIDDYIQQTLAS
ncbi:DUF885 domain-containing protein [Neiella marina]|uniref:DUF885 domain-containing protein n=1 Tax=Neiella holothuriorum TaxID=2870530 RepID=A0ABS7EK34_9GAMM|nr:DUF885 domain-containing protein [Neiella holothuriorum]MBW8192584.1 DUF885 domain-containing protein [Neiella holothuriorum]